MKRTITVMYFRDHTGKIQMREISIRKIGWLISGLIFLILTFILSAIFAIKLYADRSRLGSELASIHTEKESLEQRIKAMEASVHEAKPASPPAIPAVEPPPKAKPAKPAEKPANSIGIKPASVKTVAPYQEEAKPTPQLAMQNLKAVKTDDNQIIVALDITAINNTDAVIDGYVITIGYYGEKHLSVPAGVGVKDGLPDDFKKGSRFSIKLQLHIEHMLPAYMDNPIERFTTFIYSSQGELLIKKEEKLQ